MARPHCLAEGRVKAVALATNEGSATRTTHTVPRKTFASVSCFRTRDFHPGSRDGSKNPDGLLSSAIERASAALDENGSERAARKRMHGRRPPTWQGCTYLRTRDWGPPEKDKNRESFGGAPPVPKTKQSQPH